jgi:hypothetical protein
MPALGGRGTVAAINLARLEDVPELDPPVEQERVVGHLLLRQQRVGQAGDRVVVHGVHAVLLVAGAGLGGRRGGHLHVALDHGARQAAVVVAQEVVVDVRVELLARVHGLALGRAGHVHVGHDGGAVDGAAVHGHLHLLVLHPDSGAGNVKVTRRGKGRRRQAQSPGATVRDVRVGNSWSLMWWCEEGAAGRCAATAAAAAAAAATAVAASACSGTPGNCWRAG